MKKRDLLREYELLKKELTAKDSVIKNLKDKDDELKRSLNGECVTGPQCNACQHGIISYGTWGMDFICLKNQPCKQFERKEREEAER